MKYLIEALRNLIVVIGLIGGWGVSLMGQSALSFQAIELSFGGHSGSTLLDNFALTQQGQLITKQSELPSHFRSAAVALPRTDASNYLSISFTAAFRPYVEDAFFVGVEWLDEKGQWSTPITLQHCPNLKGPDTSLWVSQPLEVQEEVQAFRYTLVVPARSLGDTPLSFDPMVLNRSEINPTSPDQGKLSFRLSGDEPSVCAHPGYMTREAWQAPDPDSLGYTCAIPRYAPVTHAVVTHATMPAQSSNWPAAVLALWSHHVNVLGDCDMGYNWLIDPLGNIYEGRGGGYAVVGDYLPGGMNREVGSTGICLLGDLSNQGPSGAQRASLTQLLAWQIQQSETSPFETGFWLGEEATHPVIELASNLSDLSCPLLGISAASLRSEVQQAILSCGASTNIDDDLSDLGLNVYPNPNPGQVKIKFELKAPQSLLLNLTDLQGRRLLGQSFQGLSGSNERFLDLSQFANGLYYLTLQTESGLISRIIKVDKL